MLAQTTPAYDKPDDESPRPNHPEGSGGAGGVASIAQAIDLIKRELEIDDAALLGLLRSWADLAREMKGLQTEPTPELRTAIHELLDMMGLEATGHCDFGAYTHTQIAEPAPKVQPAVAQVRMSNHAFRFPSFSSRFHERLPCFFCLLEIGHKFFYLCCYDWPAPLAHAGRGGDAGR